MATWNGKPRNFSLERYDPKDYGYSHYEDVEYKWDYHTTSDILTITETDSFRVKLQSYGNLEAEALLHTLASWYATYNSKERLKDLLKDMLESE